MQPPSLLSHLIQSCLIVNSPGLSSLTPASSPTGSPSIPTMADDSSKSAEEQAEEIKLQANQLVATKDYAGAKELYSRAIALCPSIEALWTNRALARCVVSHLPNVPLAAPRRSLPTSSERGRQGLGVVNDGAFLLSQIACFMGLQSGEGEERKSSGLCADRLICAGYVSEASLCAGGSEVGHRACVFDNVRQEREKL